MSLIADIKTRLTTEELFAREFPEIRATRRGNRLWACCPFHQEETASFCIDTIKQRFTCYGCNRRGDVIDLYALAHDIENREAILRLAADLGITRNISPEAWETAQKAKQEREAAKNLNSGLERLVKESRLDCFNISRWIYLILKHIPNERSLERQAVIWALKNRAYIHYLADTFVGGTTGEQLQAALDFRRWKQSQPMLKH